MSSHSLASSILAPVLRSARSYDVVIFSGMII